MLRRNLKVKIPKRYRKVLSDKFRVKDLKKAELFSLRGELPEFMGVAHACRICKMRDTEIGYKRDCKNCEFFKLNKLRCYMWLDKVLKKEKINLSTSRIIDYNCIYVKARTLTEARQKLQAFRKAMIKYIEWV